MRKYESFWSSNSDWYFFKDGFPVMDKNAPEEAKESFKKYLEQHEKVDNQKIRTKHLQR